MAIGGRRSNHGAALRFRRVHTLARTLPRAARQLHVFFRVVAAATPGLCLPIDLSWAALFAPSLAFAMALLAILAAVTTTSSNIYARLVHAEFLHVIDGEFDEKHSALLQHLRIITKLLEACERMRMLVELHEPKAARARHAARIKP